ncbi:MAG TPA: peptidoglycan DD-metalloendopeptidase family protein [bacterium]|nr:peptidoglycan DD-metalloendopeptidase family protein [bacterium]
MISQRGLILGLVRDAGLCLSAAAIALAVGPWLGTALGPALGPGHAANGGAWAESTGTAISEPETVAPEGPDTTEAKSTEEGAGAKEQELARIKQQLDEQRQQAAKLAGQEQDLSGEIESLNKELSLNQTLLRKLDEKKAVLLDDLKDAQEDLAQAQASLAGAGATLKGRLRGIYKFGRGQAMEVVLTSETFADLTKRIYYLSIVADHDRQLMSDFEKTVEAKQVLVDHIEEKRAKLEETETEVAEETQNLSAKKDERDALVARLKDKRYYYENKARELQEASRNLEETLGKLEAGRSAAPSEGGSFAALAGRLVWPCEGEVITDFGVETQPKFGTIIKNNGIDIKASEGTFVRAVAAGTVSYAGALTGYGNAVILDHGGGYYTLYGRLESVVVQVGYQVAQGDRLGFVGETSAPEGAVLHFEIRQGKKALDPQAWLLR